MNALQKYARQGMGNYGRRAVRGVGSDPFADIGGGAADPAEPAASGGGGGFSNWAGLAKALAGLTIGVVGGITQSQKAKQDAEIAKRAIELQKQQNAQKAAAQNGAQDASSGGGMSTGVILAVALGFGLFAMKG